MQKKVRTVIDVLGEISRSPIFRTRTDSGRKSDSILFLMSRKRMKYRMTLIPPVVEPDIPPMNIKITMRTWQANGHNAYEVSENPVDVCAETAIKEPWASDWDNE